MWVKVLLMILARCHSDMCSPGGETHNTEAGLKLCIRALYLLHNMKNKMAAGASDKNIQVCKFVKLYLPLYPFFVRMAGK